MSFKLDLHVHSESSGLICFDDKQLKSALKRRGLDGLAITNFHNISHALWLKKKLPEYIIIVGQEIWSNDGHIVALGIEKRIADFKSAEETVALIHEQGGLAVAVHPYIFLGVGPLAATLPFDAIESYNGLIGRYMIYNLRANVLAFKSRQPVLASTDTTDVNYIGHCYTKVMVNDRNLVLEAIRYGLVKPVKRPLPVPAGFILKNFLHFKKVKPCKIHAVPCVLCGYSTTTSLIKGPKICLDCGVTQESRFSCSEHHYLCRNCTAKRLIDRDESFDYDQEGLLAGVNG